MSLKTGPVIKSNQITSSPPSSTLTPPPPTAVVNINLQKLNETVEKLTLMQT